MNIPKTIENQFGDVYQIASYQQGEFILEPNEYAYSYIISSGAFTKIKNGVKVSSGLMSKNPEIYKEWMLKYENSKLS